MERRTVITGIGIISSIGLDVKEFWNNCLNAKTVIKEIPTHWHNYYQFKSNLFSPLPEINFLDYNINRLEMLKLDKVQALSLAATHLALEDTGLNIELKNKKKNSYTVSIQDFDRCGVHIGTGVGGVSQLMANHAHHIMSDQKKLFVDLKHKLKKFNNETEEDLNKIEKRFLIPRRYNPFVVSMIMPNSCSAQIGIKYSVSGPNNTYCLACASGTVAIGKAVRDIKAGIIDISFCGGAEYLFDDYGSVFHGFDVANTLAKSNHDPSCVNCPFDNRRTGFLFSEGASCVLIIEELEHARKRGARIYAEVTSYGESFDAYSIMMIKPDGDAIKKLIVKTLLENYLNPSDIDYINAHGTGTLQNDKIEAAVIEEVFGKKVLVNSTKSLLGHTLGASGAIEAAVTALSIYNNKTHVCKNLEDPIRELNFVTRAKEHDINKAMSLSYGFGGHNAALVIQRYV